MSLPRAWGQKPSQKSHSRQANKKFELQCGISTFFCLFVYACATYSTARDLLTPPHASWLLPTWLDWWLRVIREAIPPSNTPQLPRDPFLGCFAIAAPSAWRHCSTSENIWLFRSSSCATRFRSQATSLREALEKAPGCGEMIQLEDSGLRGNHLSSSLTISDIYCKSCYNSKSSRKEFLASKSSMRFALHCLSFITSSRSCCSCTTSLR